MGERVPFEISCPVVMSHLYYPDRIVLVEEPKKGYSFNLPGGGLDISANKNAETIFECATREVQEETGLEEVVIAGFLGIDQIKRANKLHITLAGMAISGDIHSSAQHPTVKLATLDEVEYLNDHGRLRSPRVINRVRQYFSGQVYPADTILQILHNDPYPTIKRQPVQDSPTSSTLF